MAGIVPIPPPVLTLTMTASGAVPARRFVGADGAVCAANAKAVGASPDYNVADGEVFPVVAPPSVVLVAAGGAVSLGAMVASNSAGKAVAGTAVTSTPPTGGTPVTSTGAQPAIPSAGGVLPQQLNGQALDAAAAEDDIIRVRLI